MGISSREIEFGEQLVARAALLPMHLQQALDVCASTSDSLPKSLTKLGFIQELTLAEELAQFCGLELCDDTLLAPAIDESISLEFLQSHFVVPLRCQSDTLRVAFANPLDEVAATGLRFATDLSLDIKVATYSAVDVAWQSTALHQSTIRPIEDLSSDGILDDLLDIASDAPTIRLVQRLITTAVERRASDIHFEPVELGMKVRLRLDGVLHDLEVLPPSAAAPVASRIKVMARLNIAERRLPQDGRLRVTVNGKGIDFRVATAPALHGESVVLRILDRQEVELDFRRLGFDESAQAILRRALERPYGIILSTGPTGSGKTTTLYTALKELNKPDRKILTVEDPIEYTLSGVNQTQVKPSIGYSFATALRAFLRQDPDVLMVGV